MPLLSRRSVGSRMGSFNLKVCIETHIVTTNNNEPDTKYDL